MKYYSATEKDEIPSFATTCVELVGICSMENQKKIHTVLSFCLSPFHFPTGLPEASHFDCPDLKIVGS